MPPQPAYVEHHQCALRVTRQTIREHRHTALSKRTRLPETRRVLASSHAENHRHVMSVRGARQLSTTNLLALFIVPICVLQGHSRSCVRTSSPGFASESRRQPSVHSAAGGPVVRSISSYECSDEFSLWEARMSIGTSNYSYRQCVRNFSIRSQSERAMTLWHGPFARAKIQICGVPLFRFRTHSWR